LKITKNVWTGIKKLKKTSHGNGNFRKKYGKVNVNSKAMEIFRSSLVFMKLNN
jgi:hypothetical protein